MARKHTYVPHMQLKRIRAALNITQTQFAEMLHVSYPYLIAVETGQRDLSAELASKISWSVGVQSVRLRNKSAEPMVVDPASEKLVPFSKQTFERRKTELPTFAPNPLDPSETVTPSLKEYANAFRAMLHSAQKNGQLGGLLEGFFELFAENFSSPAAINAFFASCRTHHGGDAGAALMGYVYHIWEHPNLYRSQKTKGIQKRKAARQSKQSRPQPTKIRRPA